MMAARALSSRCCFLKSWKTLQNGQLASVRNRLYLVSSGPVHDRQDFVQCRETHNGSNHSSYQNSDTNRTLWIAALGSLGLAVYLNQRQSDCQKAGVTDKLEKYGQPMASLPTYRKLDVEQHISKDKRIWVMFRHGVYDVTDFLISHPGGNKILLAAGKNLEPFFATYGVHKQSHVMEIMEELRIGNLHPDDMKDMVKDADDPFANDPDRHPALMVNSDKPFNAEPPPELLVDSFYTPASLWFVRNHLPVPKVNLKTFKLEVSGVGIKKPVSLSVDELKSKFKSYKISAAIQCAGNRRSNMAEHKSVRGLNWGTTAISNGEWTGVRLVDVLKHAGFTEEEAAKVGHVIFQGLDKDIEGIPYEASIPAESALDPSKDVMIVYEMNGEPLTLDHGYPLRILAPGIVGARQVKWLQKIILSVEESHSHWQRSDYKSFNPSIDWEHMDYDKSVAIQEYPIQSAICDPSPGAVITDDTITVKGYAWSGGGRGIIRVDVSADGGKTWTDAALQSVPQPLHRQWSWTLFEVEIPVPEGHRGPLELICKAVDTSHNQQPENAAGIWNVRGLIHNAWHRVKINVEPEE